MRKCGHCSLEHDGDHLEELRARLDALGAESLTESGQAAIQEDWCLPCLIEIQEAENADELRA